MPFSLRCVQHIVTIILRDPAAIDIWCKKYAHGRKGVDGEERHGEMLFRRSMQRSQQSIPSCGLTGV